MLLATLPDTWTRGLQVRGSGREEDARGTQGVDVVTLGIPASALLDTQGSPWPPCASTLASVQVALAATGRSLANSCWLLAEVPVFSLEVRGTGAVVGSALAPDNRCGVLAVAFCCCQYRPRRLGPMGLPPVTHSGLPIEDADFLMPDRSGLSDQRCGDVLTRRTTRLTRDLYACLSASHPPAAILKRKTKNVHYCRSRSKATVYRYARPAQRWIYHGPTSPTLARDIASVRFG